MEFVEQFAKVSKKGNKLIQSKDVSIVDKSPDFAALINQGRVDGQAKKGMSNSMAYSMSNTEFVNNLAGRKLNKSEKKFYQ